MVLNNARRASRDGQPGTCTMYYASADFTNYMADFYTGKLDASAKQLYQASLEALRDFAQDQRKCRRRAILEFFKEAPAFGSCGACDNCCRLRFHTEQAFHRTQPLCIRQPAP